MPLDQRLLWAVNDVNMDVTLASCFFKRCIRDSQRQNAFLRGEYE